MLGLKSSKLREQARNLGTLVLHRSSSPTQNAIYYYDEGSKTSQGERHHDSRLRPAPSCAGTVPLRSHCSARGPRRDRVAGRGGPDIYTLSFSSPKTTHALRGAVLTAPQRSETEGPEADPRHGRCLDGTFDEGETHAGPFLSERTNLIYTRSRKWRLRLGRPRHRLDRDSYDRIYFAARARRPCGHGKPALCSPVGKRRHRARMCGRALRRVSFLYVVAATSFVRGRLISRRARQRSADALLLLCCIVHSRQTPGLQTGLTARVA